MLRGATHFLRSEVKDVMDYDRDRVDEMVLALLYLTSSQDQCGVRVWRGPDWEAMDWLAAGNLGTPQIHHRGGGPRMLNKVFG